MATDLNNSLDALSGVRGLRRELDILERDRITAARAEGASWDRIAQALGIRTRQGAQQRHAALINATNEESA